MICNPVSLLLISILSWTGHAFVDVRPYVARVAPLKSLGMVFDPSHFLDSASSFLADAVEAVDIPTSAASVEVPAVEVPAAISSPDYIPGTSGEVSYSRASYYTILGLYVLSFPGLWSTIKRSTAAKMKKKTYVRYVCYYYFFIYNAFFSIIT